jgi:hypothetical protein
MPNPPGKRMPSGSFKPTQPIEQVHESMRAIPSAVKNAEEARTYLYTKCWLTPADQITLETLARTLFGIVLDPPAKLNKEAANPILAVAYLITEKLEDNIRLNVADTITKHLLDALLPITNNIQEKFNTHLQAITDSNKSYLELNEKLQQTQERLEDSAQKATTPIRTYSQAAATPPTQPPPPFPPATPNVAYSQLQVKNREEIKKRQVLIDFDNDENPSLEVLNEETLTRKAKDALNATWVAATDPKPERPVLRTITLLKNGGLLLELDSTDSADWLRTPRVRESFLVGLGSGANIKDRTYQVIVQFVPIQFDPEDQEHLRQYELYNGIEANSVLKAEWIKPIKARTSIQRVATMRVYHRDAESANKILSEGASVFNKSTVPRKPKKEPIRCLFCSRFGHERRDCAFESPRCGRCTDTHETNTCTASPAQFKCVNCSGNHPSYSRDCPAFIDRCRQTDSRRPENSLVFYPTDEPWTWATAQLHARTNPPAPQQREAAYRPPGLRQTHLTNTYAPGPLLHPEPPQ